MGARQCGTVVLVAAVALLLLLLEPVAAGAAGMPAGANPRRAKVGTAGHTQGPLGRMQDTLGADARGAVLDALQHMARVDAHAARAHATAHDHMDTEGNEDDVDPEPAVRSVRDVDEYICDGEYVLTARNGTVFTHDTWYMEEESYCWYLFDVPTIAAHDPNACMLITFLEYDIDFDDAFEVFDSGKRVPEGGLPSTQVDTPFQLVTFGPTRMEIYTAYESLATGVKWRWEIVTGSDCILPPSAGLCHIPEETTPGHGTLYQEISHISVDIDFTCEYTLHPQPGQCIHAELVELDISWLDRVEAFSVDEHGVMTPIGDWDGFTLNQRIHTSALGHRLFLRFTVDTAFSDLAPSVLIEWEPGECLAPALCTAHTTLTARTGTVDVPFYVDNSVCEWKISPEHAADDECIVYTFEHLDMDDGDSLAVWAHRPGTLNEVPVHRFTLSSPSVSVEDPFVLQTWFSTGALSFHSNQYFHRGSFRLHYELGECVAPPNTCEHVTSCSDCTLRSHCRWCAADWSMASEEAGTCVVEGSECPTARPTRTADFDMCPNSNVTRNALRALAREMDRVHQLPHSWSSVWKDDVSVYHWCGHVEPEWQHLGCDNQWRIVTVHITDIDSIFLPSFVRQIPVEVFELTYMSRFSFSGSMFLSSGTMGHIPDALGALHNLEELDLFGTFTSIDWNVLRNMPKLATLTIAGDFETPFSWSVLDNSPHLEFVNLRSLTGPCPLNGTFFDTHPVLRSLLLYGCNVDGMPWDAVERHQTLEEFYLTNVDIQTMPERLPPTMRVLSISSDTSVVAEIHEGIITPNLRDLFIFDMSVVGTLPRALSTSRVEAVFITNLPGSAISGTLPDPAPPRLFVFRLVNNALTGTIPAGYFACPQLELDGNLLEGTIPSSPVDMAPCFRLAGNRLTGTIPSWVFGAGSVRCATSFTLDVSNNDLEGTLPPCAPTLGDFRELFAQGNRLTGTIPDYGRCFPEMDIVDLSNNRLTGTIPPRLFHHTTKFAAANNQLEGTIPTVGTSLRVLDLSNNRLTGKIPAQLFRNSREAGVDALFTVHSGSMMLSNNQFKSVLPNVDPLPSSEVASRNPFDTLTRFHCRNCSLTGELPLAFITLFGEVDLTNNELKSVVLGSVLPSQSFARSRVVRLAQNDIGKRNTLAGLQALLNTAMFPQLAVLDLRGCALTEFDGQNRDTRLALLDLSAQQGSGLRRIVRVDNFRAIVTLELDISNNALRELSIRGSLAGALQVLRADRNPLETLELSSMGVVTISLSHTNVTGPLPDALFTNDKLRLADLRSSAFAIPYEPACDVDLNACLPRGLRRGELSPSADPSYSCYLPQHDAAIRFEWNTYFAHVNCRCAEGFFGRRAVCHACVDGALCPGGDAQMTMHAEAGFWGPVVDLGADTVHVSHDAVVVPDVCDGTSAMYRQCAPLHRHACATAGSGGVSSDASWQSCGGDGAYHGRMCSMCTADHFALGDECLACPSDGVFALLVLFSVAVLFGIVARALRTRHKRERAGTLSIALFYVQMIALLAWVGVPLSAPLSRLALLAAPFNLELPGWECVSAAYSFRGHFWMSVFTLPVLGVLVGSVAWLAARRGVRSASHTAVHVMTMLVLAKYMSASARVLRALGVEDGGCGVGTFFVHAPAVAADTPASRAVIGMAWMLLVVLVLGVPAWLVWVLRRKHGRQGAEHVTASSRQRYGGLFECYASRWWFWEAVVTLRKLLIAMVLGVSAYGSSMASFGVFVVLLLSAVLQRAVQPFADPLDNVLEYGSLAVLSANFALAMVFFSEDAAEGTRGLITAVLVLLNALMLVSFVFALARRRRAALLVAGRVKGSGRSRRHIGAQASLASMRSMASMREGALAAVAASDAAQGAGSSGGGSGGGGGGVRSSARAHQSPLLTNMFH